MKQFTNKFNFNWGGNNEGSEPSNSLKTNGFQGGYKPPASVFNWFWHKVIKCITEIQENVPDKTSDLTNDSGFITSDDVTNTPVVDNLTSTSTTSALSAKQGKVLNDKIPSVVDNLTSTSTTSALSAKQGKTLKDTLDGLNSGTGQSCYNKSLPLLSGTVTGKSGAEIFNDYRTREYTGDTDERDAAWGNVATGNYSHAEGNSCTATGNSSHAEGSHCLASGSNSHAECYYCLASGNYSHAEGNSCTATGNSSHAEGSHCLASGAASHAEGFYCEASGDYSHAEGYYTTAAKYAHASGLNTVANDYQFVAGKCNIPKPAITSKNDQTETSAIFSIGYGTDSNKANAMTIYADGKCKGSSAFAASGADYSEYFEWVDGNPNAEDRRGKLVTLDGDKIRLANETDTFILGVVSVNGSFIGNTASEEWHGKYNKDVFDERLTEVIEIAETTDEDGNVIPAHTETRFIVNPDYDPTMEYTSREYRKEWSPVGLLGQVVVVDDGTCVVNGYCKPSANGVGTAADSGFFVMKRIDNTHIKVLVK